MEHQNTTPSLVVLDRHALFRRGIVSLLWDACPAWRCSEVASIDGMRPALSSESRILFLVDLTHPDLPSVGGLAGLAAFHPQHMFAGLSDDNGRDAVLASLTAGARGYILRATNTTQFVRALETILDGGVYAPVTLTSARPSVACDERDAPVGAVLGALTERQRDVFNLLAEGCATKTIARRLDLAVGTVKVHLAAIYRALGASSRLEAVAIAHRMYVMG